MTDGTVVSADVETQKSDWAAVSTIGGVVALVAIAGLVLDIVLTMLPGWSSTSVPADTAAWFAQFSANPLLGMRNLDFLNVTVSVIALPMYVAIYGSVRRTAPALGVLGLLLVAMGTTAFVSANAALPMLSLSRSFSAAADPAARTALLGSAQALLARGAHGSFGAYPGFAISELGTLVIALAMLRGGAFSRRVAWLGVVGSIILLAYTTAYTFTGGASTLIMLIALPGGLLMIAWQAMVARTLLALGRRPLL